MDELEKYIREHSEQFHESPPPKLFGRIRKELYAEDELEQFIRENQDEFNNRMPSEHNWEAIRQRLKPEYIPSKQVSVAFVWRMAAAFVVILCATVYVVWQVATFSQEKNTSYTQTTLEEISPELQQTEQYYQQVINEHTRMLEGYKKSKPKLVNDFKHDLEELDAAYNSLKQELIQNTGNQRIVNEMIQNLQMRVTLLNHQIQILENIKQQKHENAQTHNL